MVERIERREQPAPDRARARGRKLLAADDGDRARHSPPSRRRSAGIPAFSSIGAKPRVLRDQRGDAGLQVGFGVEKGDMGVQSTMRGRVK